MNVYVLNLSENETKKIMEFFSDFPDMKIIARTCSDVMTSEVAFLNRANIIFMGIDGEADINMCLKIKALNKRLKLIMVSNDKTLAVNAFEVDADGFLLLPINRDKLSGCAKSLY